MTHFFDSTENIFKYFLLYLAALPGVLGPGVALLLLSFFPPLVSSEALQFTSDFPRPSTFLKKDAG